MMGLAVVQAPPNLLPDKSDCHQISHALPFSLLVNNYQEISHLCVVWWVWFGSLLLGASQLVITLRLIMSGDVELNPGPLDQEDKEILSKIECTTFEEDDWNIVIDECSSLAAKWEQLSGFLGLRPSLIASIKGNHPNDNIGCWNDALLQWIMQKYNTVKFGEPSWKTLLKAIAKVDKLEFKKLAAEHTTPAVSVKVYHDEKDTEKSSPAASNVHETKGDTVHSSDRTLPAKEPNSGLSTVEHQAAALSAQLHQPEEGSSPTASVVTESKDQLIMSVPQHSFSSVPCTVCITGTTHESPNTTQPAAKPCSGFPTLSPEKLCREEKELLCQKLYTDSEDMMYKFQEIFAAMTDSLKKRDISISEITHHLKLLGPIKPTYKDTGLPPLRHQLPGLADAKTVDAAMSIIMDYCSFFNYRMLEHLINNLGTEQDKLKLAKYKEDFAKYGERRVFECPSKVGEMREEGHANMIVTLDDSFDNCTVNHLYSFTGNLQKTLNLSHLRLCRISLGSIKLIFQIPHFVQQAIFPLSSEQEAELSSLGVVQLSCGDYQFTRQQTKEEVEEAATDGDSDHTDSVGSVDSKNTCDAELSAMAAGLAVGKPGDTFSNADSALGRSSVITGTTAGVTQFSEDLFDRELRDLADMGMGHGVVGGSSENELHLASERGDLQEVKRLTEEKKLNPLQKVGKVRKNALHYAAYSGQLGVLKYFINERRCNPASQDNRAWTPLHYAALGKHLDIVRYLVTEQQMDPLCCADDGTTPLHLASFDGDINIVRYLVNELSKFLPLKDIVTSRGQDGRAPIHFAALHGQLEVVKYFVTELNCDPNIATPVEYQGRTCVGGGRITLHTAAQEGHLHIIKYLVEQCNCNPSHLDNKRRMPLHLAADSGHLDVVQYLTLEQHCDPLCVNKNNNTPLHAAALNGHLEVTKFFIETLHCPPDIRGWYNQTPLERARSKGHHHVVKYLESIHPKLK